MGEDHSKGIFGVSERRPGWERIGFRRVGTGGGGGAETLAAAYALGLAGTPAVDNKLQGSDAWTYFTPEGTLDVEDINSPTSDPSRPLLTLNRKANTGFGNPLFEWLQMNVASAFLGQTGFQSTSGTAFNREWYAKALDGSVSFYMRDQVALTYEPVPDYYFPSLVVIGPTSTVERTWSVNSRSGSTIQPFQWTGDGAQRINGLVKGNSGGIWLEAWKVALNDFNDGPLGNGDGVAWFNHAKTANGVTFNDMGLLVNYWTNATSGAPSSAWAFWIANASSSLSQAMLLSSTGLAVTGTISGTGGLAAGMFGAGVPTGPTAKGAVGVATTALRSDATFPAYRSDLPLSTTWFIDPVNGQDTEAGTTSATAIKTLAELNRRWWGARISQNTVVTILGNIPGTDVNSWNYTIDPNVQVSFVGTVGPVTGFGGAAIDNTLYTGTVTSYTNAGTAPAADDIELVDNGIPVSYTASGLLASGVMFKRTSGTPVAFWGLKDLTAKTLRCSTPQTINPDSGSARNGNPLAPGDTYSAYALWTFPPQSWGQALSSAQDTTTNGSGQPILYEQLAETPATANFDYSDLAPRRHRVWILPTTAGILSLTGDNRNCMFEGNTQVNPVGPTNITIRGGAARGNGTSNALTVAPGGLVGISGCFESQGTRLTATSVGSKFVINGCAFAVHDYTGASLSCLRASGEGEFVFAAGSGTIGLCGKGNTVPLLQCLEGGVFEVNNSTNHWANPPFSAASTSSATPIQIGSHFYTLAQLPSFASAESTRLVATSYEQNLRGSSVVGKFSGVLINAGGAAATTFANDVGALQTANIATAQQYRTRQRLVTGIRLSTPAGTPADSGLTATLFKNGVATTMTCTVAANQAAGSHASDVSDGHATIFADDDGVDVQLSGNSAATNIPYTVMVEGS